MFCQPGLVVGSCCFRCGVAATTESYSQRGAGNPGLPLLRNMLAKHGLIDGKNVRIDMRLAEGQLGRLPALAEGLVQAGGTVILAYGEAARPAALVGTRTGSIGSGRGGFVA